VLLVLAIAAVAGLYALVRRAGTKAGLNIVLITMDTTRADYLGCYGRSTARTPNIDRVAHEGVLFRRCAVSSVQTLPSHVTIMTGLYPYVHGVRRNGSDRLVPAAVTLAETLKAAGYATVASVGSFVLDQGTGIAQGFDVYRGVLPARISANLDSAERKGDQVCNDALALLRNVARQRFFLWVHFFDPHYPYDSPRVADRESPAAYEDEIAFMDAQIGRVLEELRKLGIETNTLVVLAGDHGEGLDDHDEYEHGYFLYQTTVHVPLIMRCPGRVPTRREVTGLVRLVDVAPTILDMSGLPLGGEMQGVSLRPLLTGQAQDLQLSAYTEAFEVYTLLRLSRLRALTAGRWKYVLSAQPRLYDVEADPGELHDRWAEQPELAARLREQLRTLLAEAPPPLAGDSAANLSSTDRARLESLGYLGAVRDPNEQAVSEIELFEPREPDPHSYARILGVYGRARDAMWRGGKLPAIEAPLWEVIQALPEAPSPRSDLAVVLIRQGKYVEAAALLETALTLAPHDAHIRLQYVSALVALQRWDDALTQANRVLAQLPDDATAHALLGTVLSRLQRWEEARQNLETAVRAEPRSTYNLLALGQVYRQLRMFSEAADCFRQVLTLDPKSDSARAGLQAAEQELKK
jgi:arylsulfatase A-like enzyme/Flp pilus assembly protein TadD